MTRTHLLDANALIALVLADHEHHERVSDWLGASRQFALCPVVEGALVRFLVRTGHEPELARTLLDQLYASGRCAFWPDSISYVDATWDHVRGHRQVTDAYLASLAASRSRVLATLDEGLARSMPQQVVLIP